MKLDIIKVEFEIYFPTAWKYLLMFYHFTYKCNSEYYDEKSHARFY